MLTNSAWPEMRIKTTKIVSLLEKTNSFKLFIKLFHYILSDEKNRKNNISIRKTIVF